MPGGRTPTTTTTARSPGPSLWKAALAAMPGPDTASAARVVLELARAREMIAREDALLGAAQVSGRMTGSQAPEFAGAVAHPAVPPLQLPWTICAAADAAAVPGGPRRDARMRDLRGRRGRHARGRRRRTSRARRHVRRLEHARRRRPPAARASAAAGEHGAPPTARDPLSFDALGGSGVAVVLGLVGVVLSLVISVRIGRGLVVELVGLRNSALELAGRELPHAIARLHAGQDASTSMPWPRCGPHGEDEVGQVGEALVAVHRAALKAAAERAEVAQRHLRRLRQPRPPQPGAACTANSPCSTRMERRTEDPDELEDLFRLDHLTTRMRRHAESLIILSGAAPGRGWRHARRADGRRPRGRRRGRGLRPGARYGSSREAGCRRRGGRRPHPPAGRTRRERRAVLPAAHQGARSRRAGRQRHTPWRSRTAGSAWARRRLAEANRRITDTERLDLFDSDQLGLFVVNRIAHRLDVRVALRSSVYGGVVAVVLLPGHVAGEPIEEPVRARRPGKRPRTARPPTCRAASRSGRAPPSRPRTAIADVAAAPGGCGARVPVPDPMQPPEEPVGPGIAPVPEPVLPPSNSAPAQWPSPTADQAPPSPAGRPELPRRVRQAGQAAGPPDESEPYEQARKPSERTPEEARAVWRPSGRAGLAARPSGRRRGAPRHRQAKESTDDRHRPPLR